MNPCPNCSRRITRVYGDGTGCYQRGDLDCERARSAKLAAQLLATEGVRNRLGESLFKMAPRGPFNSWCPHWLGEQAHVADCRGEETEYVEDCDCPIAPCNCGHDAINVERIAALAEWRRQQGG